MARPPSAPPPGRRAARQRLATTALRATASASRLLGRGTGSTVGGRVGLLIDPKLLGRLGAGRRIALVSGTNGKTTTTRLLVAALGDAGEVASAPEGANLPAGIVTALADASAVAPAALEVDEGYLPAVADALQPEVLVLLNLSRDQLDRVSEVRMVAARWRALLTRTPATVVANADDPLVVWAAAEAGSVLWVAAGGLWHRDAFHCPVCDARITFGASGWSCACGFARPDPDLALAPQGLALPDGRDLPVEPLLPGRFNRANAAMAAVAASALDVEIGRALELACAVEEVAGRFTRLEHEGISVRMLLAKNPAGWTELVELVRHGADPLVVAINSRIADGADPSWLWDVPFERLAGRRVVATGERRDDLAVRLRHAGLARANVADTPEAIAAAGGPRVELIGNYTAFQTIRRELAGGGGNRRARDLPPTTMPAEHVVPVLEEASSPPPKRGPGASGPSTLRIVVVHPDLLSTYGDNGNGQVLANRASWRGLSVELVHAPSDQSLPESADCYVLGGGEDGPQVRSAVELRAGALARAVEAGAVVLAVCAGYQILGERFPGAGGASEPGVGLLDVVTVRTNERRAVGEIVTEANLAERAAPLVLTGFENHAGRTRLGSGVLPLGRVALGIGNGDGRSEGARSGRVFGTYLHGPVLARNPELADVLLELVTGAPLEPLLDVEEERLRRARLSAARRRRFTRLTSGDRPVGGQVS